jgi:hypothetical protein
MVTVLSGDYILIIYDGANSAITVIMTSGDLSSGNYILVIYGIISD